MFREFKSKVSAYWNPQPKANVPESVKKEDSFIVPHYIETRLSKPNCIDHSSHILLKNSFCCKNNNGKVVAVNHKSQLCSCHKDQCKIYSKYLIKVPLGVN